VFAKHVIVNANYVYDHCTKHVAIEGMFMIVACIFQEDRCGHQLCLCLLHVKIIINFFIASEKKIMDNNGIFVRECTLLSRKSGQKNRR
jgi:hypothetical protein